MTWGIPTDTFLQIHVVLSLVGIASGLVVLYGLLTGNPLGAWTAVFLATTILTGITGFPLPPFGFDPPRAVGVILLILLTLAVAALYAFRLAGAWRSIYIVTAIMALYLNVFVGDDSGVPEAVVPATAGTDPIGAAVPDRTARRAPALHRVRCAGRAEFLSQAQTRRLIGLRGRWLDGER